MVLGQITHVGEACILNNCHEIERAERATVPLKVRDDHKAGLGIVITVQDGLTLRDAIEDIVHPRRFGLRDRIDPWLGHLFVDFGRLEDHAAFLCAVLGNDLVARRANEGHFRVCAALFAILLPSKHPGIHIVLANSFQARKSGLWTLAQRFHKRRREEGTLHQQNGVHALVLLSNACSEKVHRLGARICVSSATYPH